MLRMGLSLTAFEPVLAGLRYRSGPDGLFSKSLHRLSRLIFSAIFAFLFSASAFSVEIKQDSTIRFALWAEADAYPGIEIAGDNPFSLPVKHLKETAPYILEGMVYGFKFDYTPSDRLRGVKEFFELESIHPLTEDEKNAISYEHPWSQDNKIWCWIKFQRSEEYQKYFESWSSIRIPHAKGRGKGKLSEGFEGIKAAFADAIKNAVREYERQVIKNKPREIIGSILLKEPPLLGVEAGHYIISLDFFLQSDKIIRYNE